MVHSKDQALNVTLLFLTSCISNLEKSQLNLGLRVWAIVWPVKQEFLHITLNNFNDDCG